MVAYSFKDRFVGPISSREKRQTIRGVGKKRHARRGDRLQLYTGPRMKPRKFGEATCEAAVSILLNFGSVSRRPFVQIGESGPNAAIILEPDKLDTFAVSDGFADWQALADFWAETHDNPVEWTGILITWGDSFDPSTAGTAA